MIAKTRCTLLGTGSSGGVPRVGGDWGVCDPTEPKNRRRRCCVLIEKESDDGGLTSVLIDTSPDLRGQLLDAGVTHLDGLVYTHEHADQVHGIDDIRPLVIRRRAALPVFMNAATREILTRRFDYCFEGKGGYPPILEVQPDIEPGKPFSISGAGGALELLPFDMEHGRIRCLGFRVGAFAYCNDVSDLPDAAKASLQGLDTLVIDALRYTEHPTHANVAKALDWIGELKPRHAVLTNMHVDLDYTTLKRELPTGIEPGFDGMVLEIV
ncbi:MAG: PhnP [Hyphomonadaceae bacterium BRH_c29]|nr:MAG: PhnP [Hyphomonadaceae bacterium BRH_c29]